MKPINWTQVEATVRGLFPTITQIATYGNNQWLLVFAEEQDNFLNTIHPLTKVIRKYKLSTPLIISHKFIQTSLDSYPLEFLDIQSGYTNLYAAIDMIADLQFDKNDIRCQIERELKSKWLLTRQNSLHHIHNRQLMFRLLKDSYTSLLPVFKGFCFLAGTAIPKDTALLLNNLEEILHADVKILRYIAAQKKAPSTDLLLNLFHDYIRLLKLCSDKIDTWLVA